MALKRQLNIACSIMAIAAGALLVNELWQLQQTRLYNAAIARAQFAAAHAYRGEYGLFAEAFAAQSAGRYQDARIVYAKLEHAANRDLRAAVLYNMGNTYLQQAATIDRKADADRAAPLIELAKVAYRQLLAIDSDHWDAKFNLERALQLLPDAREQKLMELDGLRGTVRTVISAETEDQLP
jgi:mxaK protein